MFNFASNVVFTENRLILVYIIYIIVSCYFKAHVKSKFYNCLYSTQIKTKLTAKNIVLPTFLAVFYILFTISNFNELDFLIMTLVLD